MRTMKRATDYMDEFGQKKMLLLLQVSERVLNKIRIPFLCALWVRNVQEVAEVSGWHTTIPIYSFL